jgi:hypothetical protein
LLRKRLKPEKNNLDCLLSADPFQTYCLNIDIVKQSTEVQEPLATPVSTIKIFSERRPLELLQKESPEKSTTKVFGYSHPIDRIYYINLEKNLLRRQNMELWLQNHQPIPFKRINASVGFPDQCVPKKNTPALCRGVSGLARSLVGIIDNENTTGLSLVLEDDYVVYDPNFLRLQEAIKMVPADWDLIRFDCWGTWQVRLRKINQYIFDTSKVLGCKNEEKNGGCSLCGGTHMMLFKGSSVHKLKEMWSATPYDEVDCRIEKWPSVNSYCVNVGLGRRYRIDSERSDIPKIS